ncbi:MAG TPA: SMP-30/gluconolactonase/LRE family protein [Nannocystaceae bacterium]|nr:SMP-30/gluconolactonase/LRE family protein [Nannocystaceae bacterium]
MRRIVRVLVVVGSTGCGATTPAVGETSSSTSTTAPVGETSTTEVGTTAPASDTSSSSTEGGVETSTSTEGGPIFDVGGVSESLTGSDSSTGEPAYDCDNIPALPVVPTMVRMVPGGEDLEFDALGNVVIAVRGQNALFLIPREGDQVLLNPDIDLTSTAGTVVLPDGDIVVADEFSPRMARVDPDTGQMTPITYGPGIGGCNGLIVGSDGMLYCATYWDGPPTSGIARIDPDNGDAELIYPAPGIDGITFAADETLLYVNEGEFYGGGTGHLFRFPYDMDDAELGEIEDLGPPLAATQGTVDGMVADVCGNVYIASEGLNSPACAGSAAVRVAPDDTVEIVACLGNSSFTPGAAFGSGVGGWESDALYLIDWYGAIWEFPVGVPGEVLPHL